MRAGPERHPNFLSDGAVLRNFGGARVSPEDLLFFRISTSPDRAGTPLERCAMNNSADHTNSRRNPSQLGLLHGIFQFFGMFRVDWPGVS